jgi:hypothetical protein
VEQVDAGRGLAHGAEVFARQKVIDLLRREQEAALGDRETEHFGDGAVVVFHVKARELLAALLADVGGEQPRNVCTVDGLGGAPHFG